MCSVVDFHTHILPKMDDGSASLSESLQILQSEANQGVRHVVATPHFYANHQSPLSFLQKREQAEAALREAMQAQPLPGLTVGTEVHFFEGMSDCEFLQQMAIAGTSYVLVEMPMRQWSSRNLEELDGIFQKQGLTPILAHIDRYLSLFRPQKIFEKLARLPVIIQANAEFFTTRRTKRLALRMLNMGAIHLLGTDCHNLTSRPPNMADALAVIQRSLGEQAIHQINEFEEGILPDLATV